MNEWIEGNNFPFKLDETFDAVIRHCNPKLNIPDQEITLTVADDGFYINESNDELSYNWNIIKWKARK